MSPGVATFILMLGVALIFLAFAPGPIASIFSRPKKGQSLQEKLSRNLRLAGLFGLDQTPTVVIAGLGGTIVATSIVLGVLTGSVIGALAAFVIVPGVAYYMLMNRQRAFMNRVADEIGTFLNRIATSTRAGKPVQSSYIEAVEESKELRRVLADSAAKMTAGMRFSEALVETIPLLPFRMWSVFVRQLEAHDESGGDLGTAIEETVVQTNEILALQAEARADYATQSKQQKLIVGIAVGGILFFTLTVDPEIMKVLVTSVIGIISTIVAVSIMTFGLMFSRKQLKDIQDKMAF